MRCLASVLFLALLAVPAAAQPWYARGEFNGWSLSNGSTITPIDPYPMVVDPGNPNHYTSTVGEGEFFDDTRFAWKIAVEDWSTNYPNSDSAVYTNTNGGIKFHLWTDTSWSDGWFPNNTRRVGYDDPQQFGWEIVGSFNGWSNTHDTNYYLSSVGNGVYSGTFALNHGIYDFKFRGVEANLANAWDVTIGNDFGNGAGNNQVAVASDGDLWTFELDLPNGRWRTFTNAPPPGAGNYNEDGAVDAADYTVWRDHLGSTTPLPNDGGLGTPVGPGHYSLWKAHFGETFPWLLHHTPSTTPPQTQIPDTQLNDLGGGDYGLQLTGLNPGENYDFRVIRSDLSALIPGSDMRVQANVAGEVDVKFHELSGAAWGDGWSPDTTHRVGYTDPEQFTWEIVGDFSGWGSNAFDLVAQGNGVYAGDFTFPGAASYPQNYQFKFRKTGDWGISIGPDFGNSAGNNPFTVNSDTETWHFALDLPNGRWQAYPVALAGAGAGAVPEPSSVAMVWAGLMLGAAAVRRRR